MLSRAATTTQLTGNNITVDDYDGSQISVPEIEPVYDGEWVYTDANGNASVVGPVMMTQPEAEAARDAWLAAGATP